jgi:hypothetical protein
VLPFGNTWAPILSYKIGRCQGVLQKIFSMGWLVSIKKYNGTWLALGAIFLYY